MTEPEFRLPTDGETYIGAIVSRCETLVRSGIWDGLDLPLREWLRNYETPVERYFAACVLDALVYRPEPQTISLMTHLLQRSLIDLFRHDPPPSSLPIDWRRALTAHDDAVDPLIRVVPVIRLSDPPTKSGMLLARLYRRALLFDERWMIWPWDVSKAQAQGVQAFLFIDDFVGTGHQFASFCHRFDVLSSIDSAYGVYAPLAAHVNGLEYVRERIPMMRVCPVETLGNDFGLFGDQSRWFSDGTNTPRSAYEFYRNMIASRRLAIPPAYLNGYGKLALAYAFSHAIPNNCLPLLWYRATNWKPLFDR